MEAEYFEDAPVYIACIDRGYGGMFRINAKEGEWRFIVPGSVEWDSLHQNIYRNGHDYDRCPDERVTELPPLPSVPPFEFVRWEDNFKRIKALETVDYPCVVAWLENQAGRSSRVWFLLSEDLFEFTFGDGQFLYYAGHAFPSEGEAAACMHLLNESYEKNPKEYSGCLYSLRSVCLVRREGVIETPDYSPERPEDYVMAPVLRDLENFLASRAG